MLTSSLLRLQTHRQPNALSPCLARTTRSQTQPSHTISSYFRLSGRLGARQAYPFAYLNGSHAPSRAASVSSGDSTIRFGDFSSEQETAHTIELGEAGDSEGATFYCDEEPHMVGHPPGPGFIPLRFGDVLDDGTYVVVRKLSYSPLGSVWLAKDLTCEEDRYVAIKVYTIEATRASRHNRNPEVAVLKKLSQTSSELTHDNGTEPCLEAEKAFVTKSRHGKHLSVATRPYSLSMFEFLCHVPPHRFPLHIAKRIITRTLLALNSLHSAGYVHTDVKLENIVLSLSSPAQQEEISKHVIQSPPETYPPRSDPQLCSEEPIITAKSQPLPPFVLWSHEYCLGEFGQAVPIPMAKPGMEVMSPLIRAPEVTLHHPWSTPVDVWAVGHMLVKLLTGSTIFDALRTPNMTPTDAYLAQIAQFFGPFPSGFLARCEKRDEYFDGNGTVLRYDPVLARQDSLESRLTAVGLDASELRKTCTFVRRCMAIDPEDRATISELLADEWLASV